MTRTNRRRWARLAPALLLVPGLLAAAAGAELTAQAQPTEQPGELLPDLVADPVERPLASTFSDESGERKLLRFDGFVHNAGEGRFELHGTNRSDREMGQVRQRIDDGAGGVRERTASPGPRMLYETGDGHHHWHMHDAAAYSLWSEDRETEVAPSEKVGFCLVDSERVGAHGESGPNYTVSGGNFCEQHNPEVGEVTMGVSAGWRDTYHRDLAFQWVDISDVAPGDYAIRSDVDPEGLVIEEDSDNPPAFTDESVPGYLAEPFTEEVSPATPSSLTLPAESFGEVDDPEFRIEQAPERGTLDQPEGEWFSGSSVSYQPDPGYSGPDEFEFSAREAGGSFPRTPRPATAALGVGEAPEAVALGGLPSELDAGTAEQLSATGSDNAGSGDLRSGDLRSGDLRWSVEPIGGGDAGEISDDGRYQAPAEVPAAGQAVRIVATDAAGERSEATSRILPGAEAVQPRRAPDVPGEPPEPGEQALATPQVHQHGDDLLVRTVADRAGVVQMAADVPGAPSCTLDVPAGEVVTCLFETGPVSTGEVTATLQAGGALLESTRTAIG